MNMIKQAGKHHLIGLLYLIAEHYVRRGLSLQDIGDIMIQFGKGLKE